MRDREQRGKDGRIRNKKKMKGNCCKGYWVKEGMILDSEEVEVGLR